MKPDVALFRNLPWWPLLGILLYLAPLGLLRLRHPPPASAPVRALDGVSMLALSGVLPWAARFLPAPLTLAALSGILAGLFSLRHYLARITLPPLGAGQKPRLLLFRGRFLPKALRAARLSEAVIGQRLARQGIHCITDLFVLVLEPSGKPSWAKSPLLPVPLPPTNLIHWNPN